MKNNQPPGQPGTAPRFSLAYRSDLEPALTAEQGTKQKERVSRVEVGGIRLTGPGKSEWCFRIWAAPRRCISVLEQHVSLVGTLELTGLAADSMVSITPNQGRLLVDFLSTAAPTTMSDKHWG